MLVFNGTAKSKLEMLAFLYCREFVNTIVISFLLAIPAAI